ncbi:hypothetical protein [Methanoculleus bourgensis]|uniref:Uncharacterized protein n=1 Tax=Methanoculleus bourgensis TaxID=83986 RepID=A0A0X3BNQ2_9EURY|nr:hypothetical protein [Methanoculleus bourgensis]CVK33643.1 protein of unknown function [Methanoculleus bourgensis]
MIHYPSHDKDPTQEYLPVPAHTPAAGPRKWEMPDIRGTTQAAFRGNEFVTGIRTL